MANPQISRPSLQSLFLEMSVNGNALGVATGFVCMSGSGPVLVTNRHVVTGQDQTTGQSLSCTGGLPDTLHIHHNKKGTLGQWVLKSESLKDRTWIEHPQLGDQADFVALPLTDLSEVELFPYEMDAWPDINMTRRRRSASSAFRSVSEREDRSPSGLRVLLPPNLILTSKASHNSWSIVVRERGSPEAPSSFITTAGTSFAGGMVIPRWSTSLLQSCWASTVVA